MRYNLLGLTITRSISTELEAEGAWVHARVMKSGKLNLATLAKPSDKAEEKQKESQSGYKIRLGKVLADLEARYDAARHQPVHANTSGHGRTRRAREHRRRQDRRRAERLAVRHAAAAAGLVARPGGVKLDGGAVGAKQARSWRRRRRRASCASSRPT